MTKLQEMRKTVGLTQAELAEKAGLKISVLRQYEIGFRSINNAAAMTVWRLCQVLGCTLEDILEFKIPIFWVYDDEEVEGYAEYNGESIYFYDAENEYEMWKASSTQNILSVWNTLLSKRGKDGRLDATYIEL